MTAKCNLCGKFRRWEDVVTVDYSDSYYIPPVQECKTCTAPVNIVDLKSMMAEVGVTVEILTADEVTAALADEAGLADRS